MNECPYQSPISLCQKHSLNLHDDVVHKICGRNCGSTYDEEHKIYIVNDDIFLKFDNCKYKLYEYHFHLHGEHKIDGKIYPGEIHYVFFKVNSKNKISSIIDICGSSNTNMPEDILAIGYGLKNKYNEINLSKMKIYTPKTYYLYDGSLTTPDYGPVKWVVSDCPLRINIEQLKNGSKSARSLQNKNNRIILFH